MQVYNTPQRVGTDQGGSVDKGIPYMQEGIAASKLNTNYTYIPCDIWHPNHILITPVTYSTTSANGTALFTTTVGWEIATFAHASLTAVASIDAHAGNVAYVPGTLVSATETGDSQAAYVCIVAHTSTNPADFDTDYASGYWLRLTTTTFIKINHTAAGASKHTYFHYKIEGQQKNN